MRKNIFSFSSSGIAIRSTDSAVYALSLAIIRLIQWLIKGLNFYLETMLVAALLVGLLTWVVMPFLSQRVFRKWLYK